MAGPDYATMPLVEETLAEYLAPNSDTAWKSHPLLPSKPCRVTSILVGKSYSAAGQSAAKHYTMAVLQAYQAKLLKELDEGEGMTRLRRKKGVRLPSRGRVRHEMLSQSLFEKSLGSGFIFAFTTFNDKITLYNSYTTWSRTSSVYSVLFGTQL